MAQKEHGLRWNDEQLRLGREEGLASTLNLYGGKGAAGKRSIAVDQVNAWLNALPPADVQQKTHVHEVAFDVAGSPLTVGEFAVQNGFVEVITDVQYHATEPGGGLGQAPQLLAAGALLGLVRFELTFGGRDPLALVAGVRSPYLSNDTASATSASGWSWLNTPFGVERMLAFALYAKGNEMVRVRAIIDTAPRFPIVKLGAVLRSFTVPSVTFNEIWKP